MHKWFKVAVVILVGAGVSALVDKIVGVPSLPLAKQLPHEITLILFGCAIAKVLS